jgi:drug/metabolite transporter (DMT)-like permease
LDGLNTTLLQLIISAVVLIPYVLLTEEIKISEISGFTVVLVIILGIVHTGIGFYLFFTGMKSLKGQNIAALSYIDPITSLLASFIIFGEYMSLLQITGAVLLLGATFISEYTFKIHHSVKNLK